MKKSTMHHQPTSLFVFPRQMILALSIVTIGKRTELTLCRLWSFMVDGNSSSDDEDNVPLVQIKRTAYAYTIHSTTVRRKAINLQSQKRFLTK